MLGRQSLLDDLEDAISCGSPERRIETLRRVTDLFLAGADRLNDAQIGVFDDVLCHLIKRIETKAVVELSARMAPLEVAPIEIIRRLARDDEIAVAGPVLTQSPRLTTRDLVEIAQTKSQAHLLAISGRSALEELVTDELVNRGNREVVHQVAKNAGARFSQSGFTTLVKRAERDDELSKKLAVRIDLSLGLLHELLSKATEAVRAWLLAHAPAGARDEIERVISSISRELRNEVTAPRDFGAAQKQIEELKRQNGLNEAAIMSFISAGRYEQMTVALSELSSAPLEIIIPLMRNHSNDGLLIACKAGGLKWPTVCAMLNNRFSHHSLPEEQLAQAKAAYLKLSHQTAERILRFWRVRHAATQSIDR